MGVFGKPKEEGQVFYRYNAASDRMEEFVPPEPTLLEKARRALSNARSTYRLTLRGGRKLVPNVLGRATMVHAGDGFVYFRPDEETIYEVMEVSWDGPAYESHTVTYEDDSVETGPAVGTLAGAAIGTAILPGLGTLIGAAIGSEQDDEAQRRARTKTREEYEEVPATCRIYLERVYDRKEILITTRVKEDKADELLALVVIGPDDVPVPVADPVVVPVAVPVAVPDAVPVGVTDPYEELKKLKELLDLGIITQEEFERKKASLLW